MTSPPAPLPAPLPGHPRSAAPAVPVPGPGWGALWPERDLAGRPRLLVAALGAGALAALVLPFRDLGIGTFAVLMACGGVVLAGDARWRAPDRMAGWALGAALAATVALRDADWIVALCLLASVAVGLTTLVGSRSVPGIVATGLAVPLAGVRGLPWLRRSILGSGSSRRWWTATRTTALTVGLLLVFGGLFASADAVFASWADLVVPDVTPGVLTLRVLLMLVVGGVTLAGVYVALNPPRVERLALPDGTPVRSRLEWLAPVLAVVVLFTTFVAAQLSVMFGGHAYLRRATGLTYASYVHQGFGQLTSATLLTLLVVAVAARKAPRTTPAERLALRAVLGVLCLLTLVVVASALFRMHVYEEALRLHAPAPARVGVRGLARAGGRAGGGRRRAPLRSLAASGRAAHRGAGPARAGRSQPGRDDRPAEPGPVRRHRPARPDLPARPLRRRGSRARRRRDRRRRLRGTRSRRLAGVEPGSQPGDSELSAGGGVRAPPGADRSAAFTVPGAGQVRGTPNAEETP